MTAKFPDFDLARTPLPCGTMLLEASAGTGKTYAITGLAARLVAVEGLPIRELLMVTFTEAATHELRDRVRRRLTEVADALAAGKTDDPAAEAIQASGVAQAVARKRLAIAVASFDEAAISTIHGFCQRALRDNAFESGAGFEAEVVADAGGLLLDLAMDFWRKGFHGAPTLSAALAESGKLFPEQLAGLLGRLARHPDLGILPEHTESLESAGTAANAACARALADWRSDRAALVDLLGSHDGIRRDQKAGIPLDEVPEYASILDEAVETGLATTRTLEVLERLRQSAFVAHRKQRVDPPRHPFFEACDAFAATIAPWQAALRHEWIAFAREELPRLKQSRRLMTFDDMLTRVRAALQGPHGEELASSIRARHRAALIDEFQDTDPLQYEIFTRIFSGPQHRLMFIGDPKQSVYGFRGADLFTYLAAKRAIRAGPAPLIYTLRQNHRSEPGLVEAVNALFGATPDCFLHDGVDFFPSEARGTRAGDAPFSGPPEASPKALQIIALPVGDDGRPTGTTEAVAAISDHVAGEIARLVGGSFTLGSEVVGPGDIAVLVRNRHQAAAIQERLRRKRIPSVRHTEESVFQTREADELLAVLSAMLEPARERLVKAALTTRLFGLDATALYSLQTDEAAWHSRFDALGSLRSAWEEHGFIHAFRQLLVQERVRPRLVAGEDGERSLTNLLHLSELVHDAERELRLPPAGLLQWIHHQREESTSAPEAHFLRLERDDRAVQVVTLHKAKGLQYPIVFCPFHWPEAKIRDVIFHDSSAGNRLTLDLSESPDPAHVQRAGEEALAEEVRLLYVGVTRAIHRCYIYWSEPKSVGESSLARVLGIGGGLPGAPASFDAAVGRLTAAAPDAIGLWNPGSGGDAPRAAASEPAAETSLTARSFSGHIAREGMVASFSALAVASARDPRDRDEVTADRWALRRAGEVAPCSIFTLPRGTAAGNALHAVLETADFSSTGNLETLAEEALRSEAIDPLFAAPLARQLRLLFAHPLHAEDRVVRLADIGPGSRLSEVEFFFPIRRFTVEELARVYRGLGVPDLPEEIGRLRFSPIDGYMLGFIDLIFQHDGRYYIADWKSNWLGDSTNDYAPDRMKSVMVENRYHLQAHLYSVALDLFLAQRLRGYDPASHFGGVFYVFVRGLDPEDPRRGVHFERPAEGFLRELRQCLLRQTAPSP